MTKNVLTLSTRIPISNFHCHVLNFEFGIELQVHSIEYKQVHNNGPVALETHHLEF